MAGSVSTETENNICTVEFENPGKRNALSPSMLDALQTALDDAEADNDVRVVVIRSSLEEGNFCAGFDLSAFDDDAGADESAAAFDGFARRLRSVNIPVVAMIDGITWGGGVELAATCDLQVASTDAGFGLPPAKLGIVYPARGIQRYLHLLGPADASELLYTGDPVDAERAREMGLVNDVVPSDEVEARTYELAESVAENAPLALAGMKRTIRAFLDKTALTPAEREWAADLRQTAYESYDHVEAMAAFEEGRDPEFEGH
ncbi:enoyl-CoA hydratase/isomerase family protein [Natronomonas gomsonensis]|uniref:enoyl-CoA hydratase/isomerase family protein n=1 Tax=Natronomonas gomsonensis TaxID=1046043 RepID=UPI0020CA9BFF|nr:enoyl-CoA hydratase-related protein [Natronomonas gomsonensis]MCY4729918.1 enoyl-CoA hydratase/isomerase family protein [Natronomonas gomsonensis]